MAILAGTFFAAEASAVNSGLQPAPVGTGSLGAPPIATIDYLISRGYLSQVDKDLILTLSEGEWQDDPQLVANWGSLLWRLAKLAYEVHSLVSDWIALSEMYDYMKGADFGGTRVPAAPWDQGLPQ